MSIHLRAPVRVLLLAAVLSFAAHASDVRAETNQPQTTARATARTKGDAPAADRDPIDGLLIIAGIVAVVIVLAWIGSRIGDNH